MLKFIQGYIKPAAKSEAKRENSLTEPVIEHVFSRIEGLKAKDDSYHSIVLDRRLHKIVFTATSVLSKDKQETLAKHFNEKMHYDGFSVDSSGVMVLSLTRDKNIANQKILLQGIDEAIEALKDPKAVNQTMNSAQTPLVLALQKGDKKQASELLERDLSTEEKATSFQIAFNQGNIAMMEMLTEVGRYKPSPEMKNAQGVSLKQWLTDQAKGADEATRTALAALDRKTDSPTLKLSASSLAQVNAIQMDASQWMGGLSQSSTLSLPVAPQRSAGYMQAA